MARESFLNALPGSKQETRDYTEIWLWYTGVNLGQFEEANARIRQHFFEESSKRKPSYARRIARFLLQEITLAELVELGSADDPITRRGQNCEASFYGAQVALFMKDMDESAKLLLKVSHAERTAEDHCGTVDVRLPDGTRCDAITTRHATEVELSPSPKVCRAR